MNFGPNMYGTQIHKTKYIVIINNKHQLHRICKSYAA